MRLPRSHGAQRDQASQAESFPPPPPPHSLMDLNLIKQCWIHFDNRNTCDFTGGGKLAAASKERKGKHGKSNGWGEETQEMESGARG